MSQIFLPICSVSSPPASCPLMGPGQAWTVIPKSMFCERNSAAHQVSHPSPWAPYASSTHLYNLIELLDRLPRGAVAPAVSAIHVHAPPSPVRTRSFGPGAGPACRSDCFPRVVGSGWVGLGRGGGGRHPWWVSRLLMHGGGYGSGIGGGGWEIVVCRCRLHRCQSVPDVAVLLELERYCYMFGTVPSVRIRGVARWVRYGSRWEMGSRGYAVETSAATDGVDGSGGDVRKGRYVEAGEEEALSIIQRGSIRCKEGAGLQLSIRCLEVGLRLSMRLLPPRQGRLGDDKGSLR